MPFQEKPLDDVPSGTPDVQIFFHGQLLLRSEDGMTCKVAVNPLAIHHVLTIEARTKTPGRPDTIRMRHAGPLLFRQREGMLIEVVGKGATPAAFKCIKVGTPIDYTSGANDPPDADFRWILNLEGPQLHARILTAPIFDSHHIIRLQGGTYFFRTVTRADARVEHKRRDGGKDPVTFRRIGIIASASVFLDEGQSVKVRWQSFTREGSHTLTLQKAADTTHEIFVNNAPLFLDQPTQGEHPEFDELPEYYKIISDVPAIPPGTRFQLVPNVTATFGLETLEAGSPDIPCQVQRLDGTTD